ncbi:hypothetical protein G6F56_003448 [Rhizopus delemar]|nr:hypothetical protein G6F56_003448 [Rhizopus delemar]
MQVLAMTFLNDVQMYHHDCKALKNCLLSANKTSGIKGKAPAKNWVALTEFTNGFQNPALKSLSEKALAMAVDFGLIFQLV